MDGRRLSRQITEALNVRHPRPRALERLAADLETASPIQRQRSASVPVWRVARDATAG